MSTTTISITNESINCNSSILKDLTIHHKYLKIDDVYGLAKIANDYIRYGLFYSSFNESLASIIDKNKPIVNKLPFHIINFVRETIELFRSIQIENKFLEINFKNSLSFALVSKKLLKEKYSIIKMFIPFTNIRYLCKNLNVIETMFNDITELVFTKKFNVDIVLPITEFDVEINEYQSKAYQISGLAIPVIS